jgi:hypothetical protein
VDVIVITPDHRRMTTQNGDGDARGVDPAGATPAELVALGKGEPRPAAAERPATTAPGFYM